MTFMTADS